VTHEEQIVEELLAAFPGSEVVESSPRPSTERGMCSSPYYHAADHRPHPLTGRATCWKCYPPALNGARS